MAVQQNKKSPSRRGMRRAAGARLASPAVSTEKTRGDRHLRHHIAPNGMYRGREVFVPDTEQGDSGE